MGEIQNDTFALSFILLVSQFVISNIPFLKLQYTLHMASFYLLKIILLRAMQHSPTTRYAKEEAECLHFPMSLRIFQRCI